MSHLVCYTRRSEKIMKDKQETKNEQLPQPPKEIWVAPNYDKQWGVSGYYLDDDGYDIRDRD